MKIYLKDLSEDLSRWLKDDDAEKVLTPYEYIHPLTHEQQLARGLSYTNRILEEDDQWFEI